MNEVDWYNITARNNSGASIKEIKDLFLPIMIKHFRNDHKMSIREIAKNCNIKMIQVQKYLK